MFFAVHVLFCPQLAYAHAVQLLVDVFLLLTPFALFSEVGFWSIVATGVLTTFYQVRYFKYRREEYVGRESTMRAETLQRASVGVRFCITLC